MRPRRDWEPFEGFCMPEGELRTFLDRVPFNASRTRRFEATVVPDQLPTPQCDALRLGQQDPHSGRERTGSAPQQLSRCSRPKSSQSAEGSSEPMRLAWQLDFLRTW